MPGSRQSFQSESKTSFQPVPRMSAKWRAIDEALEDMQNTFGFVPEFSNFITDNVLPGAWSEAKSLRFNPHTSLDMKLKSLICLAVGAQIPCELISYFEQTASRNSGASPEEQSEAVTLAATTRHWSTVLNGSQIDRETFRKEVSQILSHAKKMMEHAGEELPPAEMFLMEFANAKETYQDIKKTLGVVPQFFLALPEEGIPGAWSEFKALHLNPFSALNGKQKGLIALAVASQIPCEYCIHFHRSVSKLNGATDREIHEAIGLAAVTRHWSALFHGMNLDLPAFKKDADRMLENSNERRFTS